MAGEGVLLTWKRREQCGWREKEHRIQVMAGIALCEGAFSLWITLCLSLARSYRSQFRFGSVFCSVELGRMWTPPQALRKCPLLLTVITMMPLSVSRTVKTVTACVIRTGWPFQKAFQWKCFFNGVPAGTLLIMCMNCSILSLPTKATPNVIGQNATSIFFNCK